MAISRPCYCTREDVQSALDVKATAYNTAQLDRAIQSASESVDGFMHRRFYAAQETMKFDWPNFQYAYPWRIWFDEAEIADITDVVPTVTTGGDTIPSANIFWGHPNYSPPYTYMELDRSTSSAFGHGATPQRDVHVTGWRGFDLNTVPAGTVVNALVSTSSTAVTGSDGSVIGVGDVLVVDTERMLVTDKTMTSLGVTQSGSGCSTADSADDQLTLSSGSVSVGEVLLLDSERMIVRDVGSVVTVERAWDGTALATHTNAAVYAARLLTVTRGAVGTTAATHSASTAATRALVPPLIHDLAVAYAEVQLEQEIGAYARTQGSGDSARSGIGAGLPALEELAFRRFGRKARKRAI